MSLREFVVSGFRIDGDVADLRFPSKRTRNQVYGRPIRESGIIWDSNSLTRFARVEYLDDFTSSEAVRRDFSDGVIPIGSGLNETVLKLAFNKRRCYAFENEWRAAIYQDHKPAKEGDYVEFDLNHLINGVYVAPKAPAFFLDAVQAILGKFSLAKPLERSPLLAPPFTKQNMFG